MGSAKGYEVRREAAMKPAVITEHLRNSYLYLADMMKIIIDSDADTEPAMKPATTTLLDGGESVALMEPMRLPEGARHREELADLAVELAAQSAGFRHSLPEGVVVALADLVRAMNCYYSNLPERFLGFLWRTCANGRHPGWPEPAPRCPHSCKTTDVGYRSGGRVFPEGGARGQPGVDRDGLVVFFRKGVV